MRFARLGWTLGGLSLASACQLLDKPSTMTIIEGSVYDKYTQKPIAGLPVVARRFRYGNYGVTLIDSVQRVRTDAGGHYSLAFDAPDKGYYRVQPEWYKYPLYNLTAYSDYTSFTDGVAVEPGSKRAIDFQLVPLIPAKVTVNLNKQGRQGLDAYLQADEQDGQGYFSTITLVTDTTRATQQVTATRLTYLVPYRAYILTVYRADKACPKPSQCQAVNVSYERFRRPVAYPDTAVIRVP